MTIDTKKADNLYIEFRIQTDDKSSVESSEPVVLYANRGAAKESMVFAPLIEDMEKSGNFVSKKLF